MDTETRFRLKAKPMEGGCHEWQSTLHRDGYGKFWYQGRQEAAHRMAWMLYRGKIPEGMWVLHTCDNRKCVNPDHLYIGDAKQNVTDKVERCAWWGRMKVPFEAIEQARELYQQGVSQQRIADKLGVHQTQVSRYVRNVQRRVR